jgi:thioesterase domain-containing protein/acyl carrier protein
VVLSAGDSDRLREYAGRLLSTLETARVCDGAVAERFADVAFTLQTGRPALPARLAVLAESVDELIGALRGYLDGEPPAGVYDGSTGSRPLCRDDDGYLDGLIASGTAADLARLASAWVAGATVDWSVLHRGVRRQRVGLPVYPFAETRYWLPPAPQRGAASPSGAGSPAPTPSRSAAANPPDGSAEPSRAEPVRAEPAPAEPAPAEPARAELPAADPARADPPRAEPAPAETAHAEPPRARAPRRVEAAEQPLVTELQAIIAQGVDMPPEDIDLDRDFASYGIDSIAALRIMQRVQARYGEDVPMAAIFEHATVRALAVHLAAEYGASAAAPTTSDTGPAPTATDAADPVPPPTKPAPVGPRPTVLSFAEAKAETGAERGAVGTEAGPLYGVYGDTGELTWLLAWQSELAAGGPVRGLQAPGFGESSAPEESIEWLATGCADAIEADRSTGPYRLAGHGLGGLVALETARILLDRGHNVIELVLLGVPAPQSPIRQTAEDGVLAVFADAWGSTGAPAAADDPDGLAAALRAVVDVPIPTDVLPGWLDSSVGWRRVLTRAAARYRPVPVAGVAATTVVVDDAGADWHRWVVPAPEVDMMSGLAPFAGPRAAARFRRHRAPAQRPEPARPDAPQPRIEPDDTGSSFLVAINRSGDAPRSFWTHHLFGDVSYCVYLSRHLGSGYPMFAVEQIDQAHRFRQFETVEEMSAAYLASVRAEQPAGPYRIGGCSFGGVIAYEMAQQLQAVGAEVSHLYLVDPLMPGTSAWAGVDASGIEETEGESLALMLIGNSACQLWRVPEQLEVATLLGRELDEQFDIMARHVVAGSPATLSTKQVMRVMRAKWDVLQLNGTLLGSYEAKPLRSPVDITVFHASRGFSAPGNPFGMPEIPRVDNDTTNGFGELAGDRLTVHVLDADHFTIVLEDNIKIMANLLRPSLDQR